MQPSYNDILSELLSIIGYPNSNQKFAAEFEELNRLEAIANLLDELPIEKQEKLKTGINDPNEFKKYVSDEAYFTEMTKVSRDAITKFIEVISPLLSLKQKQQVNHLMYQ